MLIPTKRRNPRWKRLTKWDWAIVFVLLFLLVLNMAQWWAIEWLIDRCSKAILVWTH